MTMYRNPSYNSRVGRREAKAAQGKSGKPPAGQHPREQDRVQDGLHAKLGHRTQAAGFDAGPKCLLAR